MKRYVAFKIALAYFVLGFLWILFSDRLLTLFTNDVKLLTELQTYKGWFYIALTAILLYLLIHNEFKKKNKIAEELRKSKLKAEESDRLKTAFLSNMSHEIRTPLNGILGFSNMLIEGHYESEKERTLFMDQINKNSENLMKIINDIIDISKIQENQIEIKQKLFDLNELLNQLYDHYLLINNYIKEKKLNLRLEQAMKDGPYLIHSDPDRLQQIITNLINNAVKFTPSGEIVFGYEIQSNGPIIFVRDSGEGIPEKAKEKLFNRFNQSDATVRNDGFGLGLAISKGLVEALGGQIDVETIPGQGSRFYFNIPQKN